MEVKDFDYELPERLIAQEPTSRRDESRLMVLNKAGGIRDHARFFQLGDYLESGDRLVLNDSRVIPARLHGRKKSSGVEVEVLLLNELEPDRWEVLVKPGRRVKQETEIVFTSKKDGPEKKPERESRGEITARCLAYTDFGGRILEFNPPGRLREKLEALGEMPLPPYITEYSGDPERYQTVYASREGSAAAPTAGLHFTEDLLEELKENGIDISYITLHVGLGTFRPVRTNEVEEHEMHAEYFAVSQETAREICQTRESGGRIIAVGTTVTRTLEGAARSILEGQGRQGGTEIFIYPGYDFQVIDGLLTNFHLPKSTLLMLVSALAGRENIMQAYQEAIRREYRFYSFGDAMLIISHYKTDNP